jgi:hypothetical protein
VCCQEAHPLSTAHLFLAHLVIIRLEEVPRHMRAEQERELLVEYGHREDFAVARVAIVHEFHGALHASVLGSVL